MTIQTTHDEATASSCPERRKKPPKVMMAVFAGAVIAVGIAAPAFAEGTRTSHMTDWSSGDASNSWYDGNTDATSTHVTFNDCTREFQATIRKTVTGPDPS